jgi:PDZ domain-containing protein
MSRRSVSGILACVLLVALFTTAAFLPVPFVTMSPGPTIDVLGQNAGRSIVRVQGQKTFPHDGELRLTTVSVTSPDQHISLAAAMWAWFDRTRAVYPRDVIYPPQESAQQSEQQSSVQMVSSQDTAVAAALRELGFRPKPEAEILAVSPGSAADGRLDTRDRIVSVDGTRITNATQVSDAVQKAGIGGDAVFVVRRAGDTKRVTVTPKASPDEPKKALVGVVVGEGFDFPFDVSVNISDRIGGPSAGLVFSLAVYDTLTPGSLTGGNDVAGTGTISANGHVGPIGGIQQKIVAAADAGAKIFLVPPGNCDSAPGADVKKDEIRLVKAPTLHSAVTSLEAYAKNADATLPTCG